MMAVLQDLVKAMSEAADKRRAERQKMKEKEREEVRTRRVETAKGKGRAGVPEKARDKAQDKEIQKQRTSNISLATASQPSTTKLGSSRAYRQRLPSSQRPAVTPTRGKSSHSLPTISPAVTASSKPVPNKSRSFWAAAGASANLDKALLDFRIFPTRRVSVTTKA
ncbi:hypothetical protein BC835DRAFT_1041435 [Cytidiella melzeri]|nr:hypothetical protein BC835DRAFT_1041435 [Cytidiella melzeri]